MLKFLFGFGLSLLTFIICTPGSNIWTAVMLSFATGLATLTAPDDRYLSGFTQLEEPTDEHKAELDDFDRRLKG